VVSGSALLGIDVGGTTTEAVVIDSSGTVLGRAALPSGQGRRGLTTGAIDAAHRALADSGLAVEELAVAGIGIPGIVDPAQGTTRHAVNLGIDGDALAIGPALTEALGIPVTVENDVRAAAEGAYRFAVAADPEVRHLVFLGVGTGISAGIVLDGSLHRGALGVAGEIGHTTIDPAGEPCRCGLRGCLETVAAGAANEGPWGPGAVPGMSGLFTAAEAGDPAAAARADAVATALARTVHLLLLAYGADHIVLGGGAVTHTPQLVPQVLARAREMEAASPVVATLGPAARTRPTDPTRPIGAIGAAFVAARRRGVAVSVTPVPASNEQGA
jgi:predicted NBD/HSP70 family sugar kinase